MVINIPLPKYSVKFLTENFFNDTGYIQINKQILFPLLMTSVQGCRKGDSGDPRVQLLYNYGSQFWLDKKLRQKKQAVISGCLS